MNMIKQSIVLMVIMATSYVVNHQPSQSMVDDRYVVEMVNQATGFGVE